MRPSATWRSNHPKRWPIVQVDIPFTCLGSRLSKPQFWVGIYQVSSAISIYTVHYMISWQQPASRLPHKISANLHHRCWSVFRSYSSNTSNKCNASETFLIDHNWVFVLEPSFPYKKWTSLNFIYSFETILMRLIPDGTSILYALLYLTNVQGFSCCMIYLAWHAYGIYSYAVKTQMYKTWTLEGMEDRLFHISGENQEFEALIEQCFSIYLMIFKGDFCAK